MSGYDASRWKPGDVAIRDGRIAFFVDACTDPRHKQEQVPPHWHYTYGGWDLGNSAMSRHARRLVVIDPEDAEQVERLQRIIFGPLSSAHHDLAYDLREFASPAPRIEEPQGLGAVVEDAEGNRWVLVYDHSMWQRSDDRSVWTTWPEVKAVRVLSEGVTP